ncbi:MAG: sigma-54 dependent transcriptional regulator [Candidatus Brocadiia bacterium]
MVSEAADISQHPPMNILVVDDHQNTVETVADVIEEMGHRAIKARSSEEAYSLLSDESIDIVLTDLVLTGDTGLVLLAYIRRNFPDVPALLISGHGTIEIAVAALKDGALDFLVKPLDLTRLRSVINLAVRFRAMTRENRRLESLLRERKVLDMIVGHSPAIRRVKQLIVQIASSAATVLITGESGTGKELVAEAIHALSQRAARPLVVLNSAALSSDLLESELFGHEQGSFTGAIRTKAGQFEAADGGTIFFDEIGDMAAGIQSKVLRVMERRNFMRVGGTKPITVDVRVIAATNADLKVLIADGRFRSDLFFRLNVISVQVPPLRERREDVPLLIAHFLTEMNKRDTRNCSVDAEALDALCAYSWPGNVRELRNVIERAFLVAAMDRIKRFDLPEEIASIGPVSAATAPRAVNYSGMTMDEIEKEAILSTLAAEGGNKSKAAAALGIGLKTLYRKLEKWGEHEASSGEPESGSSPVRPTRE